MSTRQLPAAVAKAVEAMGDVRRVRFTTTTPRQAANAVEHAKQICAHLGSLADGLCQRAEKQLESNSKLTDRQRIAYQEVDDAFHEVVVATVRLQNRLDAAVRSLHGVAAATRNSNTAI